MLGAQGDLRFAEPRLKQTVRPKQTETDRNRPCDGCRDSRVYGLQLYVGVAQSQSAEGSQREAKTDET